MSERRRVSRLEAVSADFVDHGRRLAAGFDKLGGLSADDVEIATAPKREVWSSDKVKLYRYESVAPRQVATPLLFVYSQVGRYTMLDLQPDRSLVRAMLGNGFDVYMIDWGEPNRSDRWVAIDDYVHDYLDGCVRHICDAAGVDRISMLGVCEGGVFAACYAATRPERVQNLVTAVTPIDFHADEVDPRLDHGQLNRWARSVPAGQVAHMLDVNGQLSGALMGAAFQAMTPMKTLTKYNLELPAALDAEPDALLNFLRMEKWLLDRPHHPAEAAKQLVINLYQNNELVRGEFELSGEQVNLGNITMPVLNVFASNDHIVPAETARRLERHVGTDDYTELELRAGHIGVFVSRKASGIFGETLAAWLADRDGVSRMEEQVA